MKIKTHTKLLFGLSVAYSLFLSFGLKEQKMTNSEVYPEGSEIADFNDISRSTDTLLRLREIDIFPESNIPVGQIVGMELVGDVLYFADRNVVHKINRKTLSYLGSIGGGVPNQLFNIFGLYVDGDTNLLIGNAQGSNLLKAFDSEGNLQRSYKNNDPPRSFISTAINSSFITDSIAIISKMLPHNGSKLIRYDLRGREANMIDEIVPVTDLHAKLDSAAASKLILSVSVLQSNKSDSVFYVLPTNKFLINSYNLKGNKLGSIDLRGIPRINKTFSIMRNLPFNTYFNAAVIDEEDNIYFHINEFDNLNIDDSKDVIDKKLASSEVSNVNLISVNVDKRVYRVYKVEGRSVVPLKMVDGKLWCFDYLNYKLILYQMPVS